MTSMRLTLHAALLVTLAATGLFGCSRREISKGAPGGTPAPHVSIYRVGATSGTNALLLPARVTAREEVTVTATIAARLTALPYAEGQRFPEGAAIAVFDAPETRDAIQGTRTALDAALLHLDQAKKQETPNPPIDLHSSRQLEIHFEMAIEASKINHLPVLQFERWV